jgi:hypothetical protein
MKHCRFCLLKSGGKLILHHLPIFPLSTVNVFHQQMLSSNIPEIELSV